MKILFISSIIPSEFLSFFESKSKVNIGGAANVFQNAVVQGLIENGADFDVISYPGLGCFPHHYSRPFTISAEFSISEGKKGCLKKYCSILGIKDVSIRMRAYRDIRKYLNKTSDFGPIAVLTYNIDTPIMKALRKLKNFYPRIIIATVITDLVDNIFDFSSNNSSLLKKIQQRILVRDTKALYPFIDKYILLTAQMVDKIPDATGKNIVIEGIASQKSYISVNSGQKDTRTLLYTGVLEDFSGVKSLVNAFMLTTNPAFKLIICGNGVLERYILEKAEIDNRIVYAGVVSHEEALNLQRKVTALINPRQPNGDITKYSFPSKTMEYLSSGTPMIGYKLEGIPEEYFDYMYTINELDDYGLANSITEVLSKDDKELKKKAAEALQFINENKTSRIQVNKVLRFLEES